MKAEFDLKTLLPRIRLEKKDIEDARSISETMNTTGWKILKDYWSVAREQIIESGKSGIKSIESEKLSALKFAILKGFDECITIPNRILERLETKEEEEENEEVDVS